MKNYRGKFMIGVYSLLSEGETLLALCENTEEFADYLKTSKQTAAMILSNLFNKKISHIKCGGKLRTVEFIEL